MRNPNSLLLPCNCPQTYATDQHNIDTLSCHPMLSPSSLCKKFCVSTGRSKFLQSHKVFNRKYIPNSRFTIYSTSAFFDPLCDSGASVRHVLFPIIQCLGEGLLQKALQHFVTVCTIIPARLHRILVVCQCSSNYLVSTLAYRMQQWHECIAWSA